MSAATSDLVALLAGRRGHFQMESGYHSEQWFELDRVLTDRDRLRPFVSDLARRLAAHRLDAICGPMTGGAILAERIAGELGLIALHTERFEDPLATGLFPIRYVLPDAQRLRVRGLRVAIVDDAISAGSAVRGTHADLLACGATSVALGALYVFGGAAAQYAAEHHLALEALASLTYSLWKPDACPLCQSGIPFEKVSDASPKI
jgi:orotate phosphoribosyltransferase